jgi:4,5-DOPA dioxygenase extradiol
MEPAESGTALRRLAVSLPKPRAILVNSAHWETSGIRISASSNPTTWHDFGGFPRHLYTLQYPAVGDPTVAAQAQRLLADQGLSAMLDLDRPRDHGVWIPLMLMYPEADIPVLQISLPCPTDPQSQIEVGRALQSLRKEGVLLIGSGSITHNLRELDQHGDGIPAAEWAQSFRDWMVTRLQSNDQQMLAHYRKLAPSAVRNHPSEEHLMPLFFALGAGGEFGLVHEGFTMGTLGMDIYRFG